MRLSAFTPMLFLMALMNVVPAGAADQAPAPPKPSPATLETLPIGTGESILINVEEDTFPPGAHYDVILPDGSKATITKLKLTAGDNRTPLPDSASIAPASVPLPLFFRNLTRLKLRVTLQQPKAFAGATATEKAAYCTPVCELDSSKYAALCNPPDVVNPSECKPVLAALAACGTEACNAVKKACNGEGCVVDLYKALDGCACSETRTLPPSTFPLSAGTQSARYVPAQDGKYTVEVSGRLDDSMLKELAENVGQSELAFKEVPPARLPDQPTVLFDAALFSRTAGMTKPGDEFRFLIEGDPVAPVSGTVIQKPKPGDTPPPSNYALSLAPLKMTVAANPTVRSNHSTGATTRVVVVPLDDTGVTNWRYLNPRSPACINCRPDGTPLPAAELPAGVVFRNRTQDRTFLVSLTLPANVATNAVEDAFRCTPGQPCKITRSVAPQNTVLFDAAILSLFKNSLIKFDVSLYGETTTLGNAAAYLSLNNPFDPNTKLTERPSSTAFKTKLSLGGRVEPQFRTVPTKDAVKAEVAKGTSLGSLLCRPPDVVDNYDPDTEPVICAGLPYRDGSTQAYRGTGSINLAANLSDRADASVTLAFRDGTYGAAEIDKTAVSEYNVSIYGINGLSLKFGKADFLIPSSGIAIAESGEGFLYSFRNFGLGHVIQRESDAGIPLRTNRDKKEWFFQARSLPLGQRWREEIAEDDVWQNAHRDLPPRRRHSSMTRLLTAFRSADLFVVRGQDKKADSTYTTAGGEIFFARPSPPSEQTATGTELHNILSGSFAGYHSLRHIDGNGNAATTPATTCAVTNTPMPAPFCDGRGEVWLLTANWIPTMVIAGGTNIATTPHTVSFAIGQGSGNNPATRRDEGFIGDPANFAPDRLFLKTFLGKMNSKNVRYEPLGLSNKRYMSVTYTNSERSLFDLVASALGVMNDVNSRSTIVSLREYKLRYPENGARDAAREANVIFNIEVPKGVTFSFDANYLVPGQAFKNRIATSRAWSFGANVTLSL